MPLQAVDNRRLYRARVDQLGDLVGDLAIEAAVVDGLEGHLVKWSGQFGTSFPHRPDPVKKLRRTPSGKIREETPHGQAPRGQARAHHRGGTGHGESPLEFFLTGSGEVS